MKVVEHWNSPPEFLIETREGAKVDTFSSGSVEFEFFNDRTLRVRFALMALIVDCSE